MSSIRLGIGFVAAVALAAYVTRVDVREGAPRSDKLAQNATQLPLAKPPSDERPAAIAPSPAPVDVHVDAAVEKALRARVTAYWKTRSRSNLLAAYAFYEPSFRAKYSAEQFLSNFQRLLRFRPEFQGIDRLRFEPDGRTAHVAVRLRSRPGELLGEELISVNEETWLLIAGLWRRQGEALLPTF